MNRSALAAFHTIATKIRKKVVALLRNYRHVRFADGDHPIIRVSLPKHAKTRTYLNLIIRLQRQFDLPIAIDSGIATLIYMLPWFQPMPKLSFCLPGRRLRVALEVSTKSGADYVIDFNYPRVYAASEYVANVIPYTLHPFHYHNEKGDRRLPRVSGIVCSGNFSRSIYDTSVISQQFGMINRTDIHDTISALRECRSISGPEYMSSFHNGIHRSSLVLMEWRRGAIPHEDWLACLSSFRFHLCAPGMTMPLCHNILEAMSVGTVPITNYPHWLNPSLQDGVHCLCYSTRAELVSAVRRAIAMDDEEYQTLQESVTAYFRAHYESFDFPEPPCRLTMLNEHEKDLKPV